MRAKLYSKGYKKVNCFRLSDKTEIVSYLDWTEIDNLITEFQKNNKWNAEHFCKYVNRIKEIDVIKVV